MMSDGREATLANLWNRLADECCDRENQKSPVFEQSDVQIMCEASFDAGREFERATDTRGPGDIPCCKCGGPVVEFSVPNEAWNTIIRENGRETDQEYLCLDCFAKAAAALIERLTTR